MAVETLKAGERASELTKQLLAFSRKQVLMPQPLNFNDSLRLISSMLNRLLGEEVTLTMDLASDLWSINGDKGQLNQVTMNLAINARDAMPNGGTLTIATRNLSVTPEWPDRYRLMPPGDYVHVSVSDTGHGMTPETLSHLFEPFFTTKEVGQGTGLGLATVYGIVKQSQGYIFADSALDQGTTFHLYYPRVIATPAVAKTPPLRRRKGSESLLVIEDQDSVRAIHCSGIETGRVPGDRSRKWRRRLADSGILARTHPGSCNRRDHAAYVRSRRRGATETYLARRQGALYVWLCRSHKASLSR